MFELLSTFLLPLTPLLCHWRLWATIASIDIPQKEEASKRGGVRRTKVLTVGVRLANSSHVFSLSSLLPSAHFLFSPRHPLLLPWPTKPSLMPLRVPWQAHHPLMPTSNSLMLSNTP